MRQAFQIGVLAVAAALALQAYGRPPAPAIVAAHTVPAPWSPETRGRLVFERYGCRLCHGEEGKGGLANPNAQSGAVPSVIIDYAGEGYTAAELRKLILNGVARLDRDDPKGPVPPYRMPGWAGLITDQEVDDLIQYLMSLHSKATAKR